tara:strand:+ start:9247 stop:9507 length:261 start_codon:yes stop_codon:yes gene_type:complete
MKTFKEFLEEASNAVQTFRDKGFRTRNLFGPGGRYKKLEPIPKPNTQAMGKKFGKPKDSKINPKVLQRPDVRDAIFTGKSNLDKKA